MTYRAFILFGSPVQFIRANSLEFIEFGPENAEIKVMSHIYPDKDEEAEVGTDNRVVKVVQGLGCLTSHISVNTA